MSRPVAALSHSKSFPANIATVDRLQDDNASRVLRRGHCRISFNVAGTNDPRVVYVAGIDEGAAPRLPTSFPTDVHHRIVGRIRAADDHAIAFEPNDGAVPELDAPNQVFSPGNDDFTAAVNRARVEALLKGNGILRCAVSNSTKVSNVVDVCLRIAATFFDPNRRRI